MKKVNTYYVRRNGEEIWLNQNLEPEEGDEVLEVRKLLLSDEGKSIYHNGQNVGTCVLLTQNKIEYEER